MSTPSARPWIVEQAEVALAAFSAQLRSGVDGAAKIPNLEWTVSDLAAHVACLPSLYRRLHAEGADFIVPTDFAAFSDASRAYITATDPATLADLLEADLGGYLDTVTDQEDEVWLYAKPTTTGNVVAMMLNELVIHGQDLAAVTGAAKPQLTRRQANAIIDAISVTTPQFVDPTKARNVPNGVYHIRFRGGRDFTWQLHDGSLSITPGKPLKPDARLNADPVTFLMSSLGRISDLRAGLTGGIVSYGRKPWRFLALGNIIADGV